MLKANKYSISIFKETYLHFSHNLFKEEFSSSERDLNHYTSQNQHTHTQRKKYIHIFLRYTCVNIFGEVRIPI